MPCAHHLDLKTRQSTPWQCGKLNLSRTDVWGRTDTMQSHFTNFFLFFALVDYDCVFLCSYFYTGRFTVNTIIVETPPPVSLHHVYAHHCIFHKFIHNLQIFIFSVIYKQEHSNKRGIKLGPLPIHKVKTTLLCVCFLDASYKVL